MSKPGHRSGRRPTAALLGAALLSAALFLLSGCRSAPPAVNDQAILALLPDGASSDFFVDVGDNRPLVRTFIGAAGANPKALEPVIDRTSYLYGAFAYGKASAADGKASAAPAARAGKSVFYLVGTGSYPGFLFGAGLARSGEWNKLEMKVGGRSREYWKQKSGRLEVAFSDRGELFASNGDIATLFTREQRGLLQVPAVPKPITDEFARRAAVFYAPAPRDSGAGGASPGLPLPGMGSLPIENLLVLTQRVTTAGENPPRYALELTFDAGSEREARTLSVVFRLSAVAILGSIGASPAETMRSLQVSTAGRTLSARGIVLTAAELSNAIFQFVGSSGIK